MTDTVMAAIAIGISLITGLLEYFFHEDVWTIVQTVFLENILIFAIQIFHYIKNSDPYLGEASKEIRRFPEALALSKSLLEGAVRASSNSNALVKRKSLEFLREVNSSMSMLAHGIVDVDLSPGGAFFRELHAGDHSHRSYNATSCVNPASYWLGKPGAILLARNKASIRNGVEIRRYFIHPGDRFDELQKTIEVNKAIGVMAYLIDSSQINDLLVRDFGVCDEGEIRVELFLDAQRSPQRARFYFAAAPQADEKIAELKRVWEELSIFAQPAQ